MATKGVGRPLTILLQADTTGFAKNIQSAETSLTKLSKNVGKASSIATVALSGLAAAGLSFAKAAADDEQSALLLEKSLVDLTGATDAQVASVESYITATSLAVGIADDELRPAFTRLLRSTKDITRSQDLLNLSLDIAAATGKPLEQVVNAVGRAYDGSTTALGKLGLGLDKATLASGDFNKIQAEIEKTVGGSAAAVASTANGSFARLKVAVDETKESIGAGLLPGVTTLSDKMALLVPFIQANSTAIVNIGLAFGTAALAIVGFKIALTAASVTMTVVTVVASGLKLAYLTVAAATGSATAAQILAELTYKKSIVALVAYNVAMAGLAVKTGIATVAQYAFNLALSLNPIGLVIIAVAALGAAFVLAYKKIEPFKKLMDSIFEKIKSIGTAIKESPVGQAIAKAFDGFRAAGGPVRQGRSYVVGENGPELFTANTSGAISPSGSFGGGGGVNITINGAIDPEGVRRSLETLFQNSARRTGPVNFAGARL